MSAYVLLNLLNELRKSDKMRGLPSILSHFRNKFDQSMNTGAGMFDSILLYDIKITLKSHFCCKSVIILSLWMQHCYGRHIVSQKSVNH